MTHPENHEAETVYILGTPSYANAIDSRFGITHAQVEALRLLSIPEDYTGYNLSENQQLLLERFVLAAMGDQKLNKKLHAMVTMNLDNTGIDLTIIDTLIYFTFKTRNAKALPAILDKVKKCQNRVKMGVEIEERHQITLKEYAIFNNFTKLWPTFDLFYKKIQYLHTSPLSKYHYQVRDAMVLNDVMETTFNTESKETLGKTSGMLAFDNTKRKGIVFESTSSTFLKILNFFRVKYAHVSKIYNKSEHLTLSHINPFPQEDDFRLRDYLYTDVYRIQFDKLISPKNKQALQNVYGSEWLNVVNDKYAQIELQVHENTTEKFEQVMAQDTKGNLRAITATLLPFGLGHKQLTKQDYKKYNQNIKSDYYKKNEAVLVCSEFVAVTTIASMVELNQQLTEEAARKQITFQHDPIKIPVSSRENLHYMLPDRFFKVLKQKDCLKKVEVPAVRKYFR